MHWWSFLQCQLSGTPTVSSQSPTKIAANSKKKEQETKEKCKQGSSMTQCSRETKGHKLPRTWVFIHHIWVKNNEWWAVGVSGDSHGGYGGLGRTKHCCQDKDKGKTGSNGETVAPQMRVISNWSHLALWVPWQSLALGLPAVTRKEREFHLAQG